LLWISAMRMEKPSCKITTWFFHAFFEFFDVVNRYIYIIKTKKNITTRLVIMLYSSFVV